jgi:hypothetical protein
MTTLGQAKIKQVETHRIRVMRTLKLKSAKHPLISVVTLHLNPPIAKECVSRHAGLQCSLSSRREPDGILITRILIIFQVVHAESLSGPAWLLFVQGPICPESKKQKDGPWQPHCSHTRA